VYIKTLLPFFTGAIYTLNKTSPLFLSGNLHSTHRAKEG